MRILLDEDVPVQCVDPLVHLLPRHIVEHVHLLNWKGKKDHALFADAKQRGVDILLTNDAMQLQDPGHIRILKKSGLHHVRYTQRVTQRVGLGLAMGAIIGAMPLVVEELTGVVEQRLVRITQLARTGRIEVVNPRTDPPAYWR